jgi:outer membrane protein TolC
MGVQHIFTIFALILISYLKSSIFLIKGGVQEVKMQLVLVIVFSFAVQSVSAKTFALDKQEFDLKKAIAFASANAPEFDSLKKQLYVTELELLSASARLYPSLDLTATHGIQDASPRSSISPWGSDFNLSLTESLYDNGVGQTNKQVALLNKQEAELHFKDQKNTLSLTIVSQFVAFSLNVKLLEIQEKQFGFVSRQYELISKDYYHGIKTKKDFLRFKTQVNRSEIDLSNAKKTVLKSKQELQRLIGIDLYSQTDVAFLPIPLDALTSKITETPEKLENHIQLKTVQIQKEINQLNADLVARKNLPEFFVSSGINYGSSNYLGTNQSFTDNQKLGWNALLTVKYNFFDWGIRSRDSDIANQKKLILNNDLDSQLLSLKSTLNQLKINIAQIQNNYDLSKELLSLEKSNLDFIEREYHNGKIQYLDLVAGLNNFADAQNKFYTSTADLLTAKYTILYHQGNLYEELLK